MRSIITHFDGDPFLLNFWLLLYGKYWCGECDKIYVTICHDDIKLSPAIRDFNLRLLAKYPEIQVESIPYSTPPEMGNQFSYKTSSKDDGLVGFIESDGFVFTRGLVDQCFRLLEQDQDIVCPHWTLIDEPYVWSEFHHKGFMRCFFFSKRSLLDKIDMDFMPKNMKRGDILPNSAIRIDHDMPMDCFGWISLQLAMLAPKITFVPANVANPDTIMNAAQYDQWAWCHIRQMSSSALGFGGDEYYLWKDNVPELHKRIMRLFNEGFPGGPAEFTYAKAIAFKLLFYDVMVDKAGIEDVAHDYLTVLHAVADIYNIPKGMIYEMKGFYRGLMKV